MPAVPPEGADSTAEEAARAARRRSRETWPLRRFDLGAEPDEDLSRKTGAGELLAMVWPLSRLAWRLSGREIPDYGRAAAPGRVLRPETPA